jgi:tetratricopeptide (TPR) repeat protein
MKSKRQEQKPIKTLSQMPHEGLLGFFQQNASRILLGLTLVVLAVLIVRYRMATNQERQTAAKTAGVRARGDLDQLRRALLLSDSTPEMVAARRDQLTAQIIANLSEALADSDDADNALRADAYATRGDLYWTLANSPVFPEATTRPALATKDSPDTYLSEAQTDYEHILSTYPDQLLDWADAEMGLAAIAENRHNWDEAAKRYNEIQKRTDAPDLFKTAAQTRQSLLDRMRQPTLVGPYPATAATTAPEVVVPTTTATTRPAL